MKQIVHEDFQIMHPHQASLQSTADKFKKKSEQLQNLQIDNCIDL
jgi:hypothetical protein